MSKNTALAVDIGYSNLKGAYGSANDDKPTTFVMPAGAGPAENMPDSVGSKRDNEFATVQINGASWVAGVEPSRLQRHERDLHANYPSTDTYMALYYAALIEAGETEIERVVTGLPVSQAKDKVFCAQLRDRLMGTFQVTPRKSITVKHVDVIAQPIGAYLDYLYDPTSVVEEIEDACVLVVDPGFYSVDWVPINDGEVLSSAAGTSTEAMSYVIEEADNQIRVDYGKGLGREFLELAIRRGKQTTSHQGSTIVLDDYLSKASIKVAKTALNKMRQSLRSLTREPSIILMTGGGATRYQDIAQDVFPKARVVVPKDPVTANVRGFWRYDK